MNPRYNVEWTAEAWAELEELPVFAQRAIMRAAAELRFEAEVETRNCKRLWWPLEMLPDASWELRVEGKFRLLYSVYAATGSENEPKTVEILRVIIKGTESTARALGSKR